MFGFGASRSSSSSSGYARAMDRSESSSVSGGTSEAGSLSQSRDRLAFEDLFSRLYAGAEGATGMLDPSILTETSNSLFSGGMGFLDELSGGAGADFMRDRLTGESPVLNEQVAALRTDAQNLFTDQNQGIRAEAIAGGVYGGGRQGVAEGIARGRIGDAFLSASANLRAEDLRLRDQLAATLNQQQIGAAGTGLASLGDLYGIGTAGFGAELQPYERLAALLGSRTVLSDSDASSFSSSEDFARAMSESFGESMSRQESRSRSAGFSFRPFGV